MSLARAQALLQQGLQHHQAGRISHAADAYAQVRKLSPQNFDARHLGGVAALQLHRLSEAIELLKSALAINARSAATHMCLGLAYGFAGERGESEKSLRRSVQLDPGNPEAWVNLASILSVQAAHDEAVEAYRRALSLNPRFAQAWTGLGSVLQLQGKSLEAVQHHSRALELEPLHAKARCSRAQALQSLHRIEEALADFTAHLQQHPNDLEAASYRLMLLNYGSQPSAELYLEHRRFGERTQALHPPRPRSSFPKPNPGKRLRVAFLSPDLRAHSVAFFLEPILKHLPVESFEIVLYHDHYREDEVSERLRSSASLWRNFVGQSLETVERQILADAPDILVDLAGHTGSNRLPLFSRRVAPVQISYLGYPNTTGIAAMDYRFTDELADPTQSADAIHTESLVRFASTAWTYLPPVDSPPVAPAPDAAGQGVVFGSFNNLSKVGPETLELWSAVLRAVPHSTLLLKSHGVDADFHTTRMIRAGIEPARVKFLGYAATLRDHLDCYGHVHIGLDPSPYNGTTTTCEALWMGVPVVTFTGERHASRVGTSLLHAIGHPEWCAHSRDEYVQIAQRLAADRTSLGVLRSTLRQQMERSPLMNHAGQARRFGEALRACWLRFCEDRGAAEELTIAQSAAPGVDRRADAVQASGR
jgi:protein O-GlcNAc transferase